MAKRVPFLLVPGNSRKQGPGDSIEALVEDGKYVEAAELAETGNQHARAASLYAKVWEFDAASRCAEAAGDLLGAISFAADARDPGRARTLSATLKDDADSSVINLLADKRMFIVAGELASARGQAGRAAELFRRGGQHVRAAQALIEAGQDDEAGRLLEREVNTSDSDSEIAAASLLLGTILARRFEHAASARQLQRATQHPDTRLEATQRLIVAFEGQGLHEAARDVLVRARAWAPELPADIDAIVREFRPVPLDTPRKVETVAGRYELGQLLGAGGAGRVFKAHDHVTGRDVAIKLYAASSRSHDSYRRFVREAELASSFDHENLVTAYDFSADHGYMVMELMTGGPLSARLSPDLGEGACRRMVLDIGAGLELAHRRGIIHRDVKPANIFFDSRGAAKLGDFGVSHLLDLGQTQTGGLIGTLAYMAPEQITGSKLTVAADIYGLGVTLFQALTGRLPFLGPDFVAAHLGTMPPRIDEIRPDLSPEWTEIVASMLVKAPSERLQSFPELRRAVQAIDVHNHLGKKALILPRAVHPSASDTTRAEQATTEDESTESEPSGPRYAHEVAIGNTDNSTLARSVDTALDRSVILERFSHVLDTATESRIRALGRGGTASVQRVLSYDREQHIAVFEAPSGAPLASTADRGPLDKVRLLIAIARALAVLHGSGHAHGKVDETTIVVSESGHPTLLAAGLGTADANARIIDDVVGAISAILGTSNVSDAWRSLNVAPPNHLTTGAQLLACARQAELELLQLKAMQQR